MILMEYEQVFNQVLPYFLHVRARTNMAVAPCTYVLLLHFLSL